MNYDPRMFALPLTFVTKTHVQCNHGNIHVLYLSTLFAFGRMCGGMVDAFNIKINTIYLMLLLSQGSFMDTSGVY